jgi:integrase
MARGSITKRGSTWTGIVDLPPDPATGRRRQKRVTARTRKEIEQKVAELLAAGDKGFTDAKNLTVADYLAGWLETIAASVKPSTLRRYRDLTRLHIVPVIGGLKVGRLTPGDVQRLYANRLQTLSPTSVRHLHSLLHRALDDAVKWGLVVRNVCDVVTPPRRAHVEMRVWSAEDARRVLAAAEGDDLAALWHLALATGMRRGELLGLKWSDVNLEAATVSVRRTLSRGQTSRLEEFEPKTQAGRRRISLPASTVEALRQHRVLQLQHRLRLGDACHDHDYVFPNPFGEALHPNTLQRAFRALIARAGVPVIRLHDLRHTAATLLLAQGVHPKIVQERLGHTDIAMTLDRYSHVTPDMQGVAADAMEAVLSGKSRGVA